MKVREVVRAPRGLALALDEVAQIAVALRIEDEHGLFRPAADGLRGHQPEQTRLDGTGRGRHEHVSLHLLAGHIDVALHGLYALQERIASLGSACGAQWPGRLQPLEVDLLQVMEALHVHARPLEAPAEPKAAGLLLHLLLQGIRVYPSHRLAGQSTPMTPDCEGFGHAACAHEHRDGGDRPKRAAGKRFRVYHLDGGPGSGKPGHAGVGFVGRAPVVLIHSPRPSGPGASRDAASGR